MNTYKDYTKQVLQLTTPVMGLRLYPFSLGHAMILKKEDSMFMRDKIDETLTDRDLIAELVFAVLVCSTTYDEFMEETRSGELQKNLVEYVNKTVEEIEATELFSLQIEIQLFVQYIKNGTTPPYYYEVCNNSGADISVNPIAVEHSIKSILMTECNYTREECLNLPYNETLADFILYAHKQGTLNIISKEECELMEKLKGKNV